MGWAVVETCKPYYPEGDKTQEKLSEYVHWVYSDKSKAEENAKPWTGGKVTIEEVEGDWDDLSHKKETTDDGS